MNKLFYLIVCDLSGWSILKWGDKIGKRSFIELSISHFGFHAIFIDKIWDIELQMEIHLILKSYNYILVDIQKE